MTSAEGDRPGGAPRPGPKPTDAPPKSFQDPANLDRAARIAQNALARMGMTYADLRPPGIVRAA